MNNYVKRNVNQKKPTPNELFKWADQIPEVLWTVMSNRSPQQAAEVVGAKWDGETFKVPMVGTEYTIDPTNQKITKTYQTDRPVSYQAGVVLLTTLTTSKGVPPSGRMTVPQELPGGRMFFTGVHSVATERLVEKFENNSRQVLDRILGVGGEMIEDADIAIRVPGLPYVPLYVLFWKGDHELSARAIIGIDDRAHFHLDLASVLALTNILVYSICKVV